MVSINTNMSSIVAQRNMAVSTNKLNQAIERMTTGYKINHAVDNAANYGIATNMNVQLSACDIAADNIAMGMDLLQTAQDSIAGMQERGSRIHALITQARNGTYGADSLSAMTQEAQALVNEISRLHANTEYNGMKIFDMVALPDWADEVKANAGTINGKSLEQCAAGNSGFIAEVVCDTPDVTVTDPTQLASAISSNTKIGIGNAETLAKLAELVNSGTSCSGKTIILTEDVDLTSICAANTDAGGNGGWTPIGSSAGKKFQGTFNGNGHKVTGLYIKRADTSFQGLFGYINGELKNIGVEGANVTGYGSNGGLVGCAYGAISNCYATGDITGSSGSTGGLVGQARQTITNSYATGTVTGQSNTGGLVGYSSGSITNSYSTGNVSGNNVFGGLAGYIGGSITITNSYATGNVTGNGDNAGGLAGKVNGGTIINSYSTGNVSGNDYTGGLVGYSSFSITNSYSTGNVSGSDYTGGLVGQARHTITNSYATGSVFGTDWVGGLVGQYALNGGTVTNNQISASGSVSGTSKVGSLIGGIVNTTNGTSFFTINITNASARSQGDIIGFEGKSDGTAYESGQMEGWLESITEPPGLETTLQVGINSNSDSQIAVDTTLKVDLSISDLTSDSAYTSITNFLNQLSQKSTQLGAAQNRLDSALESTMVQMDNLTSSLSTIRDADISKVSSDYIRQQILQQAAATLMSTANQSPAIALQLL